ncbi:MAG: hypothetical protein IKC04_00490 [Oscillospiraceae bacterium]|nr:hypothetical protein [Oscillospiraceae bacterium]
MTEERFWDTENEITAAKYTLRDGAMNMRDASRIFRLDPAPPKPENINDYIVRAVQVNDMTYFLYFLHHYEPRLNRKVYRFFLNEGFFQYDPVRFLDYKLSCVLALLECLQNYDPSKGAEFLTFAHHFIDNALLDCRRYEEAGSFRSLDEYKVTRGIAWLRNNSGKTDKEVVAQYAAEQNYSEETAREYLKLAGLNRSRVPFYATVQDEDDEETGEDVTSDDSWNYADILWNGVRAEAVQAAFDKLGYREQTLLEKRNAVCMTCGRVGAWNDCPTFEELAVMFEGSSASGAERAYRKAVDKLAALLVADSVLCSVRLKQKSKTKRKKEIATAVYEYQADRDGEWGEIVIDFETGTAEIHRLAEWDTTKTQAYTKKAIAHLLRLPNEKLPKQDEIFFER